MSFDLPAERHSLPALVGAAAGRAPDAPALLAPGRPVLRFGELLAQMEEMGRGLRARGVGRCDTVALLLPPGPEMAVAFLGTAAVAVCAPFNPALRPAELTFCLADLTPAVLVVAEGLDSPAGAMARSRGIPVIDLAPVRDGAAGRFVLKGVAPAIPSRDPDAGPGDVALLLHTSGTTARPKQVPLTHANLCASARHMAASLALSARDRCLDVMPLFHIHGLVALLASLAGGGGVICPGAFDPGAFFQWLEELDPTWYTAVPTIHHAILDEASRHRDVLSRSRLRFARSCSARLPPRLGEKLEAALGVPVIEAYGMTEAAHQIASNPLPPGERRPGSVGLPTGTEVAILDEAGRRLPPGETGEVVIRGPNVTAGYTAPPGASATAFVDGWFRTGDLGRRDADGYVYLTGRLKELINRGGEKIAPPEVDEALLNHPAVAQAAAFPVPHPTLGEDVAAVVVLHPNAPATEAELRQFVAGRLADFKVPREILIRDEIPRGATGKVSRRGLAGPLGYDEGRGGGHRPDRPAAVEPRSKVEEALVGLWAEVLGLNHVGPRDNFFALGGDSIRAVRLLAQIEMRWGRRLPPSALFRAPTVESLAAILAERRDEAPSAPLVPLQPIGSRPSLFCVHQHTGQVFCYRELARHLGPDQPVHGVAARGLEAGEAPCSRIEEMASHHVQAIRSLQPVGPYHLLGYCFGGVVAFEMARQLAAHGHEVAFLGMIQTAWEGDRRPPGRWLRAAARRVRFEQAALTERAPDERLAYVLARGATILGEVAGRGVAWIAAFGRSGRAVESPLERAIRSVAESHRAALRRYRPRAYPGRIVLFRSARLSARFHGDPYLGWKGLASGGLEVQEISTDRPTILEEPPVLLVAERVRACLDATQGMRPSTTR